MQYHAAIQQLDTFRVGQALRTQDLAAQHDWTRKEEHVGKLLKLIERKFA